MALTKKPQPIGRQLYNIRRRYRRQAERFEKQAAAEGISKSEVSRLRKAAELLRNEAQQYTVANLTQGAQRGSDDYRRRIAEGIAEGARVSSRYLVGGKKAADNRKQLEESLISGNAANVLWASTVEIWRDGGYENRREAIIEAFAEENPDREVRDLLDVADILSDEMGIDILDAGVDDDDFYRMSRTLGMIAVRKMTA